MRRAFPYRQAVVRGFSLVELLAVTGILAVLATLGLVGAQKVLLSSSLAISANNIRQLSAGAAAYLADNNYVYWPFHEVSGDPDRDGVIWWFGFEPRHSLALPEGKRIIDVTGGPLGGYVPGGFRPDPSFRHVGRPFKPKYQFGYIGVGYNVFLGGGWRGEMPVLRYWDLENPGSTVVFATSAQVNIFQRPASARNPMIEEFYGFDDGSTGNRASIHFRHHGRAMVAFANGSAGLLEMEESTRDRLAPDANVGRFAPRGDDKYLR